jgi:hypothetical protein
MSATFRVLSGSATLRIGGQAAVVNAPWEEAGIEYQPGVARPASMAGLEAFRKAVIDEMKAYAGAPAMGSADVLPAQGVTPKQVQGVIEVEAVDDPVYLILFPDPTSAHPDETFGQKSEQVELTLNAGEKWIGPVAHANAWTLIAMTA